MSFEFPNDPVDGQVFLSQQGVVYVYRIPVWEMIGEVPLPLPVAAAAPPPPLQPAAPVFISVATIGGDFPDDPIDGEVFTLPGGPTYIYRTPVWETLSSGGGDAGPPGPPGPPGPAGPAGANGSPDTAAQVLSKLITVDGSGSGLDADLLDGLNSTAFAPLASPAFTGTPTAPTAAPATNTTQIATTAFVTVAVSGATGGTITEAPNDGKPYARQSLGWNDLTDEFAAKLASSAYTAADVLAKMLTVDGAASGLDADLLDGNSSAFYATASSVTAKLDASAYTAADVLTKIKTVDGTTSGLDADLLDGLDSTAFAVAAHTHSYASLTGIPSTFAPSAHSHPQSEVTNLVTDLGLKAPLASPAFTGTITADDFTGSGQLRLTNTTAVSTSSTDHALQIGADASTNLRFEPTRIQALNNGVGATLGINMFGGTVSIAAAATGGNISMGNNTGPSTTTINGLIRLATGSALSLSSTGHTFQIGGDGSGNLRLDTNDVQAVSNGAAAALGINLLGGNVTIGDGTATVSVATVPSSGSHVTNKTYVDGKLAGKITVASSAPGSPATNDVWIDTT